jgi:2-amino-4-hydroxy-6-hydroxymethyldihydropteridine diphosphokinase
MGITGKKDEGGFAFTIAYIGIGANLGDARANVADALERL